MVLGRKTNRLLEERCFWAEKPAFLKKTKKQSFGTLYGQTPKKLLLTIGKTWFSCPRPFFPRKELVCQPPTTFFLGSFSVQNHFVWNIWLLQ